MTDIAVIEGNSPLLLTQPHSGTFVPDSVLSRLNSTGKQLKDTDWHIPKLYDNLSLHATATIVQMPIHRYVIDCNRGVEDQKLYSQHNTTGLCPATDFDGNALWLPNCATTLEQQKSYIDSYHRQYHQAILEQITRIKSLCGMVILYDCHSIRSTIPYLFEGRLPLFSIGTNSGASCANKLETSVRDICRQYNSTVVNGRFKGGWTTRHYGNPSAGVHSIQMELAQYSYMEERAPWRYDRQKAQKLRSILTQILNRLIKLTQEKL